VINELGFGSDPIEEDCSAALWGDNLEDRTTHGASRTAVGEASLAVAGGTVAS
jgi:hypothetical protein